MGIVSITVETPALGPSTYRLFEIAHSKEEFDKFLATVVEDGFMLKDETNRQWVWTPPGRIVSIRYIWGYDED